MPSPLPSSSLLLPLPSPVADTPSTADGDTEGDGDADDDNKDRRRCGRRRASRSNASPRSVSNDVIKPDTDAQSLPPSSSASCSRVTRFSTRAISRRSASQLSRASSYVLRFRGTLANDSVSGPVPPALTSPPLPPIPFPFPFPFPFSSPFSYPPPKTPTPPPCPGGSLTNARTSPSTNALASRYDDSLACTLFSNTSASSATRRCRTLSAASRPSNSRISRATVSASARACAARAASSLRRPIRSISASRPARFSSQRAMRDSTAALASSSAVRASSWADLTAARARIVLEMDWRVLWRGDVWEWKWAWGRGWG